MRSREAVRPGDGRPPEIRVSRVVLVEVEEASRRLLYDVAESEGHVVLEAECLQAARALCDRESDCDLIVLSVGSQSGGEELLRVLRSWPETAQCRVVALTAPAGLEQDRLLQCGFDACLAKPVEEGALRETLNELLDRPAAALARSATGAIATGGGRSRAVVLVVDDARTNRMVAQAFLADAGYEVLLASSGAEALSVFARRSVDIILLDVLMPDMDGFETCRRLRARAGGAETPILFLTSLNDHSSHQLALDSGGDDYLMKPVQQVELLLRVKSLVRIKLLMDELRAQRDAVLLAQEQRRRLSRMIVHDLKSPIQAVVGYADMQLSRPLGPKLEKYARQIRRAGERMHGMVVQVLETERNDHSGLLVVREQTALRPFLEQLIETMEPLARHSGHTLVLESTPQLDGVATVDQELLRRTLENLIKNALEHTPPGTVGVRVRGGEGAHTFEVHDQGPGVPEESRERIFEPRVRLSRNDLGSNHGLGLAFCRLAVHAHGGDIWVEDRAGGGSRFRFSVPAGEPGSRLHPPEVGA